MTTYTTGTAEMLDAICKRYYGDEHGTTEKVLAANRGLAALGPVLPLGTKIELPDLAPASTPEKGSIRLWD